MIWTLFFLGLSSVLSPCVWPIWLVISHSSFLKTKLFFKEWLKFLSFFFFIIGLLSLLHVSRFSSVFPYFPILNIFLLYFFYFDLIPFFLTRSLSLILSSWACSFPSWIFLIHGLTTASSFSQVLFHSLAFLIGLSLPFALMMIGLFPFQCFGHRNHDLFKKIFFLLHKILFIGVISFQIFLFRRSIWWFLVLSSFSVLGTIKYKKWKDIPFWVIFFISWELFYRGFLF